MARVGRDVAITDSGSSRKLSDTMLESNLMTEISPLKKQSTNKVTMVGVGAVGMAGAFAMLQSGFPSQLVLLDVMADKVEGEVMDLQHGQCFNKECHVTGGTDYALSAGSKVCVVTAGVRQAVGESRLNLVQRNASIFQKIIPELVRNSPNTILVIVSNPVDIMTHIAWKISGLPKHRVIGSGTMLDSSRFRYLISKRLHVASGSVHAYIIGEHGDSSVPCWSGANCGGVLLRDKNDKIGEKNDPDNWGALHDEVVQSAYKIIKLKGYTSWAIGSMISELVSAIIRNQRSVYCLSTNVQGLHGIAEDIYMSLPCVIGETGITHIFKQTLTDSETKKLVESAKSLHEILSNVKLG